MPANLDRERVAPRIKQPPVRARTSEVTLTTTGGGGGQSGEFLLGSVFTLLALADNRRGRERTGRWPIEYGPNLKSLILRIPRT